MEVKIISKSKNVLLHRNEVVAEVNEKTIPSKTQLRDKLSALLNAPIETIIIEKVESKFGSPQAKIYARQYDTVEHLKSIESEYVKTRNFGKEKKAGEAEGAEAPPANFKK